MSTERPIPSVSPAPSTTSTSNVFFVPNGLLLKITNWADPEDVLDDNLAQYALDGKEANVQANTLNINDFDVLKMHQELQREYEPNVFNADTHHLFYRFVSEPNKGVIISGRLGLQRALRDCLGSGGDCLNLLWKNKSVPNDTAYAANSGPTEATVDPKLYDTSPADHPEDSAAGGSSAAPAASSQPGVDQLGVHSPSVLPNTETLRNPIVQDLMGEFHRDFPHGYSLITTSGAGLRCGLQAAIHSLEAQLETMPAPTLDELLAICKTGETARGLKDTDTGDENYKVDLDKMYSLDFVNGVINEYALPFGYHIHLTAIREDRDPLRTVVDRGSGINVTIWVYNNNAEDDFGVIGHFSGVRRNSTPPASPRQSHLELDDNQDDTLMPDIDLTIEDTESSDDILGGASDPDPSDSSASVNQSPPSGGDPKRIRIASPVPTDGSRSSPSSGQGDRDSAEPVAEPVDLAELQRVRESETQDEEVDQEATEEMLKSVRKGTVISQQYTDLWNDASRFFKISTTQVEHDKTVKFAGLKLGLRPSQLNCTYWAITQPLRRDILGGFVCDTMGVGKTFEGVSLWFVNCWLIKMADAVAADRIMRDGPKMPAKQHLPASTADNPHTEEMVCPSKGVGFPFECLCNETSNSYQIYLTFCRRAPTLIITPPSVSGQWAREIQRYVDIDNTQSPLGKLHLILENTDKGQHRGFTDASSESALRLISRKPSRFRGTTPRSYTPLQWSPPNKGAEKVIVVVNSSLIATRLESATLKVTLPSLWTQDGKPRTSTANVPVDRFDKVHWGIMIRDEFHSDKGPSTKASSYFSRPHPLNPTKWALSGTPLETGPQDLAGHIKALDKEWERNPRHKDHGYTLTGITSLERSFQALISRHRDPSADRPQLQQAIREFGARQIEAFEPIMIRRTIDTPFFGKPLTDLPPLRASWVAHYTPARLIDDVQELTNIVRTEFQEESQRRLQRWEESGRRGERPRVDFSDNQRTGLGGTAFVIRLCAAFPGLARVWKANRDWRLRAQELQADFGRSPLDSEAYKNSLFYTAHDQIVDASPKLASLDRRIDRLWQLNQERTRRFNRDNTDPDIEYKPFKMVVWVQTPAIGLIIIEHLRRTRAKVNAVWIHALIGRTAREEMILNWTHEANKTRDSAAQYLRDSMVLISQISLCGTGTNLQGTASEGIVFDMEYLAGNQEQGLRRVYRPGVRLDPPPVLSIYRMADNVVEVGCFERQSGRLQLTDAAWNITVLQKEQSDQMRRRREERAEMNQRAREEA